MPVDKANVCNEMRERFDLHDLDPGSLEDAVIDAMQNHFEHCDGCKDWLSTWEIVKMSAMHLADLPVPEGLAQKVMAKLDEQPVENSSYREIIFAAGCLAVVLVFLAAFESETLSEILAWGASFAILACAQFLFSAMKPQVVA